MVTHLEPQTMPFFTVEMELHFQMHQAGLAQAVMDDLSFFILFLVRRKVLLHLLVVQALYKPLESIIQMMELVG